MSQLCWSDVIETEVEFGVAGFVRPVADHMSPSALVREVFSAVSYIFRYATYRIWNDVDKMNFLLSHAVILVFLLLLFHCVFKGT